jgi:cytochrome c553
VTFDGLPDPDSVGFGAVLLRSGRNVFDAVLDVDLVGRAVLIRPRALLAAGTQYAVYVEATVRALDGRTLSAPAVATFDIGATTVGRAPRPPLRWGDVRPLLVDRGGCARCHGPGEAPPARRLDLTVSPRDRELGLVDVPSLGLAGTGAPLMRVAAGDPARSVLVRKLVGGDGRDGAPFARVDGTRMPPDAPPLDDDAIAAVARWIADGALE